MDQEPHLKIDSEFVPALGIEDAYKYLGLQIRAGGTIAQVRNKFIEQLKQIGRAPLKPQQRLWLLKSNSLPGLLHQLVLAKTTKIQLRSLDILVRKSVRGWLKLPHDTPVSYFHSDVKDGGLGIPCMLYDLPEKICQRLVKLQCSSDPIVAKIAAAQGFSDRLAKWSERRSTVVDGRGLALASAVPYTHTWVSDGTGLMSGHLYCAAIAARCNLLPT